ncbi:MAG: carbon-nitrogen hydrolase family protein [Deltaproteobacteria bacterium]|nr:carbon-nitrogen hydrolase family protein [Deltaproteobacteria bacterium]
MVILLTRILKITLVVFIIFIFAGGCTQKQSHVGAIDYNLQKQRTENKLKIAFIHLNVRHKNLEINRQNIIELNRKAADQGADLILNPELSLSGYSFSSRDDIAEYAISKDDCLLTSLSKIAKEHGAYIIIGLAERDDVTWIYYNSAIVIDPDGRRICTYRKINAESRWACPGRADQEGFFDTQWGRVGLLICSDTYYGLLPRSMALKGVDLLLVPANWPPGDLDPGDLWRARAMENGFFLAACNRTGQDLIMDCRKSVSYLFDPAGDLLFEGSNEDSCLFMAEIPLDQNGKLAGIKRQTILAKRNPLFYRSIYLDRRLISDLTDYYKLPQPGTLNLEFIVPEDGKIDYALIENNMIKYRNKGQLFYLLPEMRADDFNLNKVKKLAEKYQAGFAVAVKRDKSMIDYLLITNTETLKYTIGDSGQDTEFPFPIIKFGTAQIAIVPFDYFKHSELALALAKTGCDLVLLPIQQLDFKKGLSARVKSTENIAVAVCANNGAALYMPPEGHLLWEKKVCKGTGIFPCEIDTVKTREKSFQDRVDFELILGTQMHTDKHR